MYSWDDQTKPDNDLVYHMCACDLVDYYIEGICALLLSLHAGQSIQDRGHTLT